MGLLQKACETYDHYSAKAGIAETGHETLAPISHIVQKAQIEITINADGFFLRADKIDERTIIPATIESAGRSSKGAIKHPHPLCDKLSYLIAKENYYIPLLAEWVNSEYSHPIIRAVAAYVKRNTILNDLQYSDIIKLNEDGSFAKGKIGGVDYKDCLVRWRIIGLGEEYSQACWEDTKLHQAYIEYYNSVICDGVKNLCMITGNVAVLTNKHPSRIIPNSANAKIISANDKDGFTYRGRFSEDWQAGTVSYEASQKAHNALRWIAAEQKNAQRKNGGRFFLCWNPHGVRVPNAVGPFRRGTPKSTPFWYDYKKELMHTLNGWKSELPENNADVVITALDAASDGRLSICYYNELQGSDFLQRLHDWDEHCCWWNGGFGIQSPALYQIVNCAFGTQRTEKGKTVLKTDDRVMKQQMQRLVSCRVDRAIMPRDIENILCNRASTPQAYTEKNWRSILYTACAVINIAHYQRNKGENVMDFELDKHNRDFQFGRLLAAMEQVEVDYNRNKNIQRQTTAMKLMSRFRQRPLDVYAHIHEHLQNAYIDRIYPFQKKRYLDLKTEIMEILLTFPENELNKPLRSLYLVGYERQMIEFRKSKKQTNNEEE